MATKLSKELTVINKLGIHARPAALFVKVAGKFDSHIEVKKMAKSLTGRVLWA